MEQLKDQFDRFLQCWQFFTRVPLPDYLEQRIDHDRKLSEAVHLFPVVGLCIGTASAIIWLLSLQFLPPALAAGMAVLSTVLMTGAIHEDGLIDSADGFFGGYTKNRRLEIMKDSTIGAFGGIALLFSIAFRWTALLYLTPAAGAFALLISHTAARAVMSYPICFSRYARHEGLGKAVSQGAPVRAFIAALGFSVLLAIFLGGFTGLIAVALATLAGILLLNMMENRIDGYTGDGLGAIEQIAEVIILLTFVSAWSTA